MIILEERKVKSILDYIKTGKSELIEVHNKTTFIRNIKREKV